VFYIFHKNGDKSHFCGGNKNNFGKVYYRVSEKTIVDLHVKIVVKNPGAVDQVSQVDLKRCPG